MPKTRLRRWKRRVLGEHVGVGKFGWRVLWAEGGQYKLARSNDAPALVISRGARLVAPGELRVVELSQGRVVRVVQEEVVAGEASGSGRGGDRVRGGARGARGSGRGVIGPGPGPRGRRVVKRGKHP
jgi:hypothetical protein